MSLGITWDNGWLGGLLLTAPLAQIRGPGWEGLSRASSTLQPGPVMLGGDL